MIKPEDVDEVRVGMAPSQAHRAQPAFPRLLNARVSVVSADRITNEKSGQAFYRSTCDSEEELKKLKRACSDGPMPSRRCRNW